MTKRSLLLTAASLVLAACGGDSDEGKVRQVSHSMNVTRYADSRPTQRTDIYELILPPGFTIETIRSAIVIDQKKRQSHPTQWSLRSPSDGEQRVTITFLVPEDAELTLLQLNEFEIDLRNSRIRRTRTRSATR